MRDCFSHWLHLNGILCNKDLNHVHFDMLFESSLCFVSLGALVTLEGSLPSVRPLVPQQMTRNSESIVALVTFERLFSSVLPHYMDFQIASCDA